MKFLAISLIFLGCSTLDQKQIDYSSDHDIIDKILRTSVEDQRLCYNNYLENNPKAKISYKALITLNNDGVIKSISFNKNLSDRFENCLKYSIYKLRFPGNINPVHKTIEITQPFTLRPD